MLPLYNVKSTEQNVLQKINNLRNSRVKIEEGDAKIRNMLTLAAAGNYILDGGLAVMCPEGIGKKDAHWQKGVGALLKLVKRNLIEKGKEGYVILCDVQGITFRDYIKDKISSYIPTIFPFKSVQVRYSNPIPISSIDLERKPSQDVASEMEEKFRIWLKR